MNYLSLPPLEAGRGKALGKIDFEMHRVRGGHAHPAQRWANKWTCRVQRAHTGQRTVVKKREHSQTRLLGRLEYLDSSALMCCCT